jgi:mitochondrial translocator assembly and maintenance protein 41
LHKPVFIMKSNNEVMASMNMNHFHAVNVALCLLPERFSEKQLYKCIAQLSYTGDPRMYVAENPNKVCCALIEYCS